MKKIVLGFIVGVLISTGITYAGEMFSLVKVEYLIKVNKQVMNSDLPILNYEGNTYIPLRKVAEATGSIVTWDGENRVVEINNKKVEVSKEPIIEWKYAGFEGTEPYKEYEIKYVDGVATDETRYNGKNHEVKLVTLYTADGRKVENVPEHKVKEYGTGWSTTNPNVEILTQGFITEGPTTRYATVFTDDFGVVIDAQNYDLGPYTSVLVSMPYFDKSSMNIPTIIGHNELFEERYFPKPVNIYGANFVDEYKAVDFFENLSISEPNSVVTGFVVFDTRYDLDYITYDDGIHECTLYLK